MKLLWTLTLLNLFFLGLTLTHSYLLSELTRDFFATQREINALSLGIISKHSNDIIDIKAMCGGVPI